MPNLSQVCFTLLISLFSLNASANISEGGQLCEDSERTLKHHTKGFLDITSKGTLEIIRKEASKRAEGGKKVVYEATSLNLGLKIDKKDIIKNKELIDSYMSSKETVTIEYEEDLAKNPNANIVSIHYWESSPGQSGSNIGFSFYKRPKEDCVSLKGVGNSWQYIEEENTKIPKGNYALDKCAKFHNLLKAQSDIFACLNSAEKLFNLKKELAEAKGDDKFDAKKERKMIEQTQKDLFKAFEVVEESSIFNRTCERLYSRKGLVKEYQRMQAAEVKKVVDESTKTQSR